MMLLALLIMLIPIGYSLYKGWEAYKEIKTPGQFFLFPDELNSGRLRDSITASNISLGAAIFAFLSFGYSFKIAAIISPLTWLLGFVILIYIFPKITGISEGRTLHGFLSLKYNSYGIGYLASIASIIGFLGTYGIEVLVAIKLFRVILPNEFSDVALAILIGIIVTSYTALGGFKAATHADRFRLYGTIFGILVVFGYSLYIAFTSPNFSASSLNIVLTSDGYGFSSLTALFVVSLSLLNIPWQLVDMSVWQRLSACRNKDDITRGLKQSIYFIGILWLILISLGFLLNFFPNFIAPANGDYATLFLSYLNNPIVFALFSAGCIAALMSTADSLLIASVQTLVMDVFFPNKAPTVLFSETDSNYNKDLATKILRSGRKWIWLLGISAPIIIYLINIIIPGILDLFFIIYCAQLSLLISVIIAIHSKDAKLFKRLSFISISFGLATSLFMFIKMLISPTMETFLWAPIVSVILSILPWLFFPFYLKPKEV